MSRPPEHWEKAAQGDGTESSCSACLNEGHMGQEAAHAVSVEAVLTSSSGQIQGGFIHPVIVLLLPAR